MIRSRQVSTTIASFAPNSAKLSKWLVIFCPECGTYRMGAVRTYVITDPTKRHRIVKYTISIFDIRRWNIKKKCYWCVCFMPCHKNIAIIMTLTWIHYMTAPSPVHIESRTSTVYHSFVPSVTPIAHTDKCYWIRTIVSGSNCLPMTRPCPIKNHSNIFWACLLIHCVTEFLSFAAPINSIVRLANQFNGPNRNSLKCVSGRCAKNLEAVRLWNQAIHKNSVFLAELREHNIKIYPVSNEDIALSLDCTEPISQEKCKQLQNYLFSSDPNDQTCFASIKQQHLMKIYTNYSMVRPIGK